MTEPFELLYYRMQDGRVPYRDWLETVTDPVAYAAVQSRMGEELLGGLWEKDTFHRPYPLSPMSFSACAIRKLQRRT